MFSCAFQLGGDSEDAFGRCAAEEKAGPCVCSLGEDSKDHFDPIAQDDVACTSVDGEKSHLSEHTSHENHVTEEGGTAPVVSTPGVGWWSRRGLNYGKSLCALTHAVTAVWIFDRLVTNVWPRESFTQVGWLVTLLGGGTSSDRVPLKLGPWTVPLYDVVARISGRFLTTSLNILMWTMMHTTHRVLQESWFARCGLVDFAQESDESRRWLHNVNGYLSGFLVLFHVYSILFPVFLHGYSAYVTPGSLALPLSERRIEGTDVDNEGKLMGLQGDDVWRLIEMTLFFVILFPWSLRLLRCNYRVGIQLHRWVFILYFIDIARRHSHPHNWVLNVPVFFLWVADVAVGNWWRVHKYAARRQRVSSEHVVCMWSSDTSLDTSGPLFLLRSNSHKCCEPRHPMRCFQNRGLATVPPDSICDPTWHGQVYFHRDRLFVKNRDRVEAASHKDELGWTACAVVRVYTHRLSHTRQMMSTDDVLSIAGPFADATSDDMYRQLQEVDQVVVVGGGSALAFLVDALQNHVACGACSALFVFLSHDVGLIQWFTWIAVTLYDAAVLRGGVHAENAKRQEVRVFFTCVCSLVPDEDAQFECNGRISIGRPDFVRLFASFRQARCHVFAEGPPSLHRALRKACAVNGCRLYGTYTPRSLRPLSFCTACSSK